MTITSPTPKLLEAEEIRQSYLDGERTIEILRGVSISLERGELVALAGPSGSGKSTLLAVLGGLLLPKSGSVRVDGTEIVALRAHHLSRLRREKIGFVIQGLGLFPRMSVLENIALPLIPSGGAGREDQARISSLLEHLDITALATKRVEKLSGGERQRVAIARALTLSPSLLLLDEPTASLDKASAARVLTILDELRREGPGVLIATHDPRILESSAVDRVLELKDGALI